MSIFFSYSIHFIKVLITHEKVSLQLFQNLDTVAEVSIIYWIYIILFSNIILYNRLRRVYYMTEWVQAVVMSVSTVIVNALNVDHVQF